MQLCHHYCLWVTLLPLQLLATECILLLPKREGTDSIAHLRELDETQGQESYYLSPRTVIPSSVGRGDATFCKLLRSQSLSDMYLVPQTSICRHLPPTSQYTHPHTRVHAHMVWISVCSNASHETVLWRSLPWRQKLPKQFTKCLINPGLKMPSTED